MRLLKIEHGKIGQRLQDTINELGPLSDMEETGKTVSQNHLCSWSVGAPLHVGR